MDAVTQVIKGSVLIADSESAGRSLLQADLLDAGWEVLVAETGRAALQVLQTRPVCAVILDLRLADMNGPAWLQQARMLCPGLPVVAIATAPLVEMAVAAMRAGACDVLSRPVSSDRISQRLASLVPVAPVKPVQFGRCITVEPTLAATLTQARQLAESHGLVAICGAPGTGRKTLAAAMHQARSPQGPITSIDLAVLSPEQARTKLGQLLDNSSGACLTLADPQCLKTAEQDRLPPLLTALSQAGGAAIVTLSERPERLSSKGQLSRSLAQMVDGAVLHLPPLAARRSDMPWLARQILAEILPQGCPVVAPAAMEALIGYDWPGNVRQLRLVLDRAARLATTGLIETRHLPILQAVKRDPVSAGWCYGSAINLQEIVDDVERHLIGMALRQTHQNQAKAAELLNIPRTTLRDKLSKHGFLSAGGE